MSERDTKAPDAPPTWPKLDAERAWREHSRQHEASRADAVELEKEVAGRFVRDLEAALRHEPARVIALLRQAVGLDPVEACRCETCRRVRQAGRKG